MEVFKVPKAGENGSEFDGPSDGLSLIEVLESPQVVHARTGGCG